MKFWCILFWCMVSLGGVYAQAISIDFPVERTVFQRDLSNQGTIYLSGNINRKVDSIQIKLVEYVGNNEVDYINWKKIANQSAKGYFLDEIKVKGGWYKLMVRAFVNGSVYADRVLNKVGVGEVFIVAGQSNAQGISGYGGIGAKDDRVNCTNFQNGNTTPNPRFPITFSQLGNNVNVGPMGNSVWAWGELGDMLVNRLGVPVMFFNASLTATMSKNWAESSRGEPTFSAIFWVFLPRGLPYDNLKISLQQYASLLGVRAVLWHQGETDTSPGDLEEEETYGYYKQFIQKSRDDYGKNVAWVVSKASYSDGQGGVFSDKVIRAQTRIINEPGFNIFEGPNTDNIQIPRPDGVHFQNTDAVKGISLLAAAWADKLNNNFFSSCQPIIEKPIAELELSCNSNSSMRLTVPSGYSAYWWSDNGTENTKFANSGKWNAILRDSNGRYKLTNQVNVSAVPFTKPLLTSSKNYLCEDEELNLLADNRFESVVWMNSTTNFNLNIRTGGNYSYNATNGVGCSFSSDILSIEHHRSPIPLNQFSISIDQETVPTNTTFQYCATDNPEMIASSGFETYLWSDGYSDGVRKIQSEGVYSVRGIYGRNNCQTPEVTVRLAQVAVPQAPIISQTGIFDLIAEPEAITSITTLAWFKDNDIHPGTAKHLHISESGSYTAVYRVKTGDNRFCASETSFPYVVNIDNYKNVVLYPNPVQDDLNLESREIQSNLKVYLIDMKGAKKPLFTRPEWDRRLVFPIGNIASPGNYILLLESDQAIHRQKISIQ
jgi:hypothetical protein